MIVALAGHVDHGKTSLVHALTGVDTDCLAEEKRRGLTIDLGFAYADFDGRRVGFVDVPGHHRFVHNMVAGIAGRQYALLVVAADDGVMPQSHEHLQILRLLGLTAGVVALNKIDRVADDRVAAVKRGIETLVAGSFLEGAAVIPLSCATGAGVADLRRHLAQATRSVPVREEHGQFRLAIDRAFTIRGSGVVVTGTVVSGSVAVDARLALASSGKPVRVRGLHVQDAVASKALAGDRTAINLAGVGVGEVARGDWLLDPATREPATGFAVALAVLEDFPRVVKHNAPVHVYHATSHSQGRLLLLDSAPLPPAGDAVVDVACLEPLHVKVGDRIVFRDHDLMRTLGGGRVVGLHTPAKRRQPARRRLLAAVRPDDIEQTLSALANIRPVAAAAFASQWNRTAADIERTGKRVGLSLLDGHLLHPNLATDTAARVQAMLAAHHAERPDSAGMTGEDLRSTEVPTSAALSLVLASMVATGDVRLENGRYALSSHRAAIPDTVLRLFATVEKLLDSAQPPSLGDVAKRLKRPFAALEREMRTLPIYGLATRISDNRYYLPHRLLALAEVAVELADDGPFTVRQFRDASGVGRNVVIEVLEHFDAKGFTRRQGDARRVVGGRECLA